MSLYASPGGLVTSSTILGKSLSLELLSVREMGVDHMASLVILKPRSFMFPCLGCVCIDLLI